MRQSIAHVALLVRDYDEAIAFFTKKLRFTLVAPPGGSGTSLLLARAATPEQEAFIGDQAGGRVFLFLSTDDFDRDHRDMKAAGIRFVREAMDAPYGRVAVFEDLYGNRWDLIQFAHRPD